MKTTGVTLLAATLLVAGVQADTFTSPADGDSVPPGTYELIQSFGNSPLSIGDGVIVQTTDIIAINAYENSTINMSGGHVYGHAFTYDSSTLNISGGIVDWGYAAAFDQSIINISGGQVLQAGASQDATVNLSGGWITSQSEVGGYGTFNMNGGVIERYIDVVSESSFHLSGGVIRGNGYMTPEHVFLRNSADVYIYAVDFGPNHHAGEILRFADLTQVPDPDAGYNMWLDDLVVTFADGNSQNLILGVDGYGVGVPQENDWTGAIYLIPEPSSTTMIALVSGLGLFIRRRII